MIAAVMRYSVRGREGYWAWMLHRVSGLAVLAFLALHIVDIWLMTLGPEWFDAAVGLYRHPLFRVGEVFVFAGVLYHALNGLRIIALDLSGWAFDRQRGLWFAVLVTTAVVMVPVTARMLGPVLR
jgi:succinate dehydrogenase / fumarate reductase cytochrome b subunit